MMLETSFGTKYKIINISGEEKIVIFNKNQNVRVVDFAEVTNTEFKKLHRYMIVEAMADGTLVLINGQDKIEAEY